MFYSRSSSGEVYVSKFLSNSFWPKFIVLDLQSALVSIFCREKYNPRNIESTWNNIALDLLLYNCAIVAVVTLVIFILLISSASLIHHGFTVK